MTEGRLAGKTAIVTGGGQTPGTTIGNGRATAIAFAREGARVLVADLDLDSATETVAMISAEDGDASVATANVAVAADCEALVATAVERWGRLDIVHNNVGIGGNDGGPVSLEEASWDRIMDVNLKSMYLMAKYTLPVMRTAGSGAIINISSVAAIASTGMLAYKTSKAGVLALTQNLAAGNARYGIRVNCILPGLMNTPMAVEGTSRSSGRSREDVVAARDAMVPLKHKMGTAWDVAWAAVFLASDEAGFITGVNLPVDGGQSIKIG